MTAFTVRGPPGESAVGVGVTEEGEEEGKPTRPMLCADATSGAVGGRTGGKSQGAPPWVSAFDGSIGGQEAASQSAPPWVSAFDNSIGGQEAASFDASIPTGRGVIDAAGAQPGESVCDVDRAPVSREGYTGVARTSESPAWGTLRSFVAVFTTLEGNARTERVNVQYFLPFLPLSFLLFLPPCLGWHSEAP